MPKDGSRSVRSDTQRAPQSARAHKPFRLLVIADPHYASMDIAHPRIECPLGLELTRRAIADAARRGGFDAVVILGDVINDGSNPDELPLLEEMAQTVREAVGDVPVLLTPGNHDGPHPTAALDAFRFAPGLHELDGVRLLAFADAYRDLKHCTRTEDGLRLLAELNGGSGGGHGGDECATPLVALQHNPIHPVIEGDYPHMPTNRREIMAGYERAGVALSISGHYHKGQPEATAGGVRYVTCRALCEPPHPYYAVTLRGRQADVLERPLHLSGRPAVWDCHTHTQFAYCRDNVTAEAVVARARKFGLAGVCITEHAPQLYCRAEDFWEARHIHEPEIWRGEEHSRMAAYRAAVAPLRAENVRVGLEVELDRDGELVLKDEDRAWADLLLGAIHWLPKADGAEKTEDPEAVFMDTCEKLIAHGVDVLAHPLRIFRWLEMPAPKHLYAPLAEMLASGGVAAEFNIHGNEPDPAFLAECIRRGVKISLGSDSHHTAQVAGFGYHLDVLERLSDGRELADILYSPAGG